MNIITVDLLAENVWHSLPFAIGCDDKALAIMAFLMRKNYQFKYQRQSLEDSVELASTLSESEKEMKADLIEEFVLESWNQENL